MCSGDSLGYDLCLEEPTSVLSDQDEDTAWHDTPQNYSKLKSSSTSYGEIFDFMTLLAASAKDAGFCPSLVVNFLSAYDKKERKRKEKNSRRQSQNDGLDRRDDVVIWQNKTSQMEESESQPSNQISSEKLR